MYVRESFPLALCRCGDRASCKSGLASGLLAARYAERFSARCAIWKKPVQGSAPPTGSKKLGKFGKEQSSGQNQTRSMIFQSIYFNYLFGYFHSAWTSQSANQQQQNRRRVAKVCIANRWEMNIRSGGSICDIGSTPKADVADSGVGTGIKLQ